MRKSLRSSGGGENGDAVSRRGVRGFNSRAFAEAREASGLSMGDLARLADVSSAAVQRWEAGIAAPQLDSLVRVSQALGVELAELLELPTNERSLVDLRNLAGVTQSEAADHLGITAAALSKLERAQTRLTPERARELGGLYGVTVAEIGAGWERARQRPPGALP